MFKFLPRVLTLTDAVIPKGVSSYKFISPTELNDSSIVLYKMNNNNTVQTTPFTGYTYKQQLLDGVYSVTITISPTINNKIAVYINGARQVWHKGIFYTLVSITENGNTYTYKWLPADTFTYSDEGFEKLE